jgi:hypothetical protein
VEAMKLVEGSENNIFASHAIKNKNEESNPEDKICFEEFN